MNKFFNLVSVLSIILSGCAFNVEAKHRVSSHSRKMKITCHGMTTTKKVHVRSHWRR